MILSSIFKAYDIRGIYPKEINEKVVYAIARSFVLFREKELKKNNITVVLGKDMRISSPSLYESTKQGLLDQGAKVIEIDLVSTPTFYFAVCFLKTDGGLIISASHNPKEYNGVKLVRTNAEPIGKGNGMEEIKNLAQLQNWTDPKIKGASEQYNNIIDKHVEYEIKNIDLSLIKSFKIVADPANAMGADFLVKLFEKLPQIELTKINFILDGSFPAHEADPFKEENLVELKKVVLQEKADLGIATDGDGDRVFFIDNKGESVDPAIIRAIFSKIFLQENPGAVICYDIRPGKITEETILQNGGIPKITKVGHSFIKKQMIEKNAVFGGESSGHYFVKFPHGVYEAPMIIILKLLLELSKTNLNLSDYILPYKKYYHSGEINFKGVEKNKAFSLLKEKYFDAEINDLDGLTFTYPEVWFNVRGSNTESLVRLNVEGISSKVVQKIVKDISDLFK